jgi:hypothetical protein
MFVLTAMYANRVPSRIRGATFLANSTERCVAQNFADTMMANYDVVGTTRRTR